MATVSTFKIHVVNIYHYCTLSSVHSNRSDGVTTVTLWTMILVKLIYLTNVLRVHYIHPTFTVSCSIKWCSGKVHDANFCHKFSSIHLQMKMKTAKM
jgi:hypothetical protein